MGSVRMYRPAPRMVTAEAKIYFRDVVDARGAKTKTCGFYPTNPRKSSNPSEFFILFPQFTGFHRICPPITVSVPDFPTGPVFVHHPLHFTPFSNFLKKKVNFFQKSVDKGIPLCYTLDD